MGRDARRRGSSRFGVSTRDAHASGLSTLRDGVALRRASLTGWRRALIEISTTVSRRASAEGLGAMARREGWARNGGSGRCNDASLRFAAVDRRRE